jgi:hypothetical protein
LLSQSVFNDLVPRELARYESASALTRFHNAASWRTKSAVVAGVPVGFVETICRLPSSGRRGPLCKALISLA